MNITVEEIDKQIAGMEQQLAQHLAAVNQCEGAKVALQMLRAKVVAPEPDEPAETKDDKNADSS